MRYGLSNSNADGSGAFTIVQRLVAEVDLGSGPRYSGSFTVAGFTNLGVDDILGVFKSAGPYTGKGTLADEAEMDMITACASVVDTTHVKVFWQSQTAVRGNHKFFITGS